MSIFNTDNSNNSLIGVDLGVAVVKVVELAKDADNPRLVTYGISTDENSSEISLENKISKNLVELMHQARVSTNRIIGALPATSVFSTIVELPNMSPKEVNSAIQWEVKKLVPFPLDKMSLNWHILPDENLNDNKPPQKLRIIINAAPINTTQKYIDIFKKTNLKLIGLETEIKALQRSLLTPADQITLIIDIGATNTSLMVFDKTLPLLTKNVEIGGSTLTANIATSLNINPANADQTKIKMGINLQDAMDHPVVRSLKFSIDNILIREIRYISTILRNSNSKNINKIILTGGSAKLKNLDKYLEKELQIKTVIGDPWQKIKYPIELKEELDEIGPKMAVAIGLALKIIEK